MPPNMPTVISQRGNEEPRLLEVDNAAVVKNNTANVVVSFINNTTVLSDKDLKPIIAALQAQLDEDVVPSFNKYLQANKNKQAESVQLVQIPKGGKPVPGSWWMVGMDTTDVPDAGGYHDLTDQGLPLGKYFAKDAMRYGDQPSVVMSHELLEMWGDPDICECVEYQDNNVHFIIAKELCDPVEMDSQGYKKNGVLVSNFVLGTYFESFWKPGQVKFDFLGELNAPLQILEGGYLSIIDLDNVAAGWQQITPDTAYKLHSRSSYAKPDFNLLQKLEKQYPRRKIKAGNRRHKRMTPRHLWYRSAIKE